MEVTALNSERCGDDEAHDIPWLVLPSYCLRRGTPLINSAPLEDTGTSSSAIQNLSHGAAQCRAAPVSTRVQARTEGRRREDEGEEDIEECAVTALELLDRICRNILFSAPESAAGTGRRINIGGEAVAKRLLPAVRLCSCGEGGVVKVRTPCGCTCNSSAALSSSSSGDEQRLDVVKRELAKRGFVPSVPPLLGAGATKLSESVQIFLELPMDADKGPIRDLFKSIQSYRSLIGDVKEKRRATYARWLVAVADGERGDFDYFLSRRNDVDVPPRTQTPSSQPLYSSNAAPKRTVASASPLCSGKQLSSEDLLGRSALLMAPIVKAAAKVCLAMLGILDERRTSDIMGTDGRKETRTTRPSAIIESDEVGPNNSTTAGAPAPNENTQSSRNTNAATCIEDALLIEAYKSSMTTVGSVFDQERRWSSLKKEIQRAQLLFLSPKSKRTCNSHLVAGYGNDAHLPTSGEEEEVEKDRKLASHVLESFAKAAAEKIQFLNDKGVKENEIGRGVPVRIDAHGATTTIAALAAQIVSRSVCDLLSTVSSVIEERVDEASRAAKYRAIESSKKRAADEHRKEYLVVNFSNEVGGRNVTKSGEVDALPRYAPRVDRERLFTAVSIIADISALMERCAMITNSFARFHRTASLALLEQFKASGGTDFEFLYGVKEEWETRYEALKASAATSSRK